MVCSHGPADGDVDLTGLLAVARAQVLLVELEQAQEVDEVGLHEAQAAQVAELVVAEAQLAEVGELGLHVVEMRAQVDARACGT
jgi:hypothetical protein